MSRHRSGPSPIYRPLLAVALSLLVCAPAWGYIVFLKDGSQIQTKEKPRIEGDKVILVLPSGTEAFYDASEVDMAKTEEVNKVDYGTAKLLEGLDEPKLLPKDLQTEDLEPTFGDVITGRSLALPPLKRRQAKEKQPADALPCSIEQHRDVVEQDREIEPVAGLSKIVRGPLEAPARQATHSLRRASGWLRSNLSRRESV